MIYRYQDEKIPGYKRHNITIEHNEITGGVNLTTSPGGVWVPDGEIPALIAALQDYLTPKGETR